MATFDLLLLGVIVFLGFQATSLALQVSGGYSATLPSPEWSVRLQVINGSTDETLLRRVVKELKECADEKLEIEIVETSSFERTSLPQTYIVSREKDLAATEQLAQRLGLDPDHISFEPLENNRKHITATLILGAESDKWLVARKSTQEEATRN